MKIFRLTAFDIELEIRGEDNSWTAYLRDSINQGWERLGECEAQNEAQLLACRLAQTRAGKDDGRSQTCEASLTVWKESRDEHIG